jgi:hypothetical protein
MAATQATSLTRISSGLQDARLQPPRGRPEVAQFVSVLRKTTRWAAQWRRVEFDGAPEFGQRVSLTVPRLGELLGATMIVVTMPDIAGPQERAKTVAGSRFLGPTYGWTNSLGHALLQRVELEIGGTVVATLDSRLMEVLDELYEPVETLKAKNRMIARAPNGFGPTTWRGEPGSPITVYIPIPFWFSKPGVLSHALPIDALNVDRVRIHVTFRPVEQLYYTDARSSDAPNTMPPLQGGRFWQTDPSGGEVSFLNASMGMNPTKGSMIPDITMPQRLGIQDAYMLAEYYSLEELEAIALRSAELTYHVEQWNAIPVQATQQTSEVRIPLPLTNPTKEILWVCSRPEAEAYNAWFLFTRDLRSFTPTRLGPQTPCLTPWWPDAVLTPLATNQWRLLPAFRSQDSEPIKSASLYYNSYERFELDGGSLFRALLPSLYCTKSAVHDRFVYVWPFGYGEKQRQGQERYEPRGVANWDKIPRKELYLTMNEDVSGISRPNMNVYVWTTIWNVFKVYGGRGSMLFSN